VVKTIEPDESDASDSDLLQHVQRGEAEAFAPVVRRHLPSLRAFVAIHLPVPHLADEIAHETFVFALLLATLRDWLVPELEASQIAPVHVTSSS
jgi:hypothetical protein